jgi:hypothetical protein
VIVLSAISAPDYSSPSLSEVKLPQVGKMPFTPFKPEVSNGA